MTILTYILTLSLLIMSAIKASDLFIAADKDLKEKRLEFIRETRKTHQDGSITLMGALLTLMFSALLMFFALKFKVELKEAHYRKDSYLCFHYLNIQTSNYVSAMTKFNWALRSAYATLLTGVLTVEAKAIFDGLKITRNGRHLYYIKNLLSNQYCSGIQSSTAYLKHLPYKTHKSYLLDTNIDETTQIKEAEWKITYYKEPSGIRLKNSFCLQARMSIQGSFTPDFKIATSEISMTDFSKLKCLSGLL